MALAITDLKRLLLLFMSCLQRESATAQIVHPLWECVVAECRCIHDPNNTSNSFKSVLCRCSATMMTGGGREGDGKFYFCDMYVYIIRYCPKVAFSVIALTIAVTCLPLLWAWLCTCVSRNTSLREGAPHWWRLPGRDTSVLYSSSSMKVRLPYPSS